MRWTAVPLSLVLLAGLAFAGVASIHNVNPNNLPVDPAVRDVYLDLQQLEPMAMQWAPEWKHATPKADVAARLSLAVSTLEKARMDDPGNEDLALLAGLAAHYAYNVDVQQGYGMAERAYLAARKLAPDDYRPDWFLAVHQCQSGDEIAEGMRRFLANESRFPWDKLPVDFWDDYMACAIVNRMPAHTLRAASHLWSMNAPADTMREFRTEQAHKLIEPPSHVAATQISEVWATDKVDGHVVLMSTLCGMAFGIQGEWKVGLSKTKDSCVVQIQTGPHPGPQGDISPSVVVMAQPARSDETLVQFTKRILEGQPAEQAMSAPRCPVDECLAYHTVTPGLYQDTGAGDGHVLLIAFARTQPEFPGVRFERPDPPPRDTKTGDVVYFAATPRLGRIPGTIYYLVMLDVADSVLDKAQRDFEFVVNDFEVE
jgi:hypothetical protein